MANISNRNKRQSSKSDISRNSDQNVTTNYLLNKHTPYQTNKFKKIFGER